MAAVAALLFLAYACAQLARTRRRAAAVLALIGGPALLLNATAVALIGFVTITGAVELPRSLALLGLARSVVGIWWGGLVVMREIGDASWHIAFAGWVVCDLSIAALTPSPRTFLLFLGACTVHLAVSALHRADARAR